MFSAKRFTEAGMHAQRRGCATSRAGTGAYLSARRLGCVGYITIYYKHGGSCSRWPPRVIPSRFDRSIRAPTPSSGALPGLPLRHRRLLAFGCAHFSL